MRNSRRPALPQAASAAALQRQQRLVEQGFVAALRLDELVAARDRDAARVREVQAQHALATAAAGRSDEIAAATAEARGSAAELALAQWRQGQRQRAAPVDAVVFDVMYRSGEWVAAGAPVVALLPPGGAEGALLRARARCCRGRRRAPRSRCPATAARRACARASAGFRRRPSSRRR